MIASDQAHVTVPVACRMLGLGAERLDARVDRRPGPHGRRGARGSARGVGWAGDRLRSGGRRELRRLRSARRRGRALSRARGWCHVDGAFGSGPRSARRGARCFAATNAPTRGRPTPTSGSTSPTTAGSRRSPIASRAGRSARSASQRSRPRRHRPGASSRTVASRHGTLAMLDDAGDRPPDPLATRRGSLSPRPGRPPAITLTKFSRCLVVQHSKAAVAVALVGGHHRVAVVPVQARLGVEPEGAPGALGDPGEDLGVRLAAVGARVAEHDHGRARVEVLGDLARGTRARRGRSRCSRRRRRRRPRG